MGFHHHIKTEININSPDWLQVKVEKQLVISQFLPAAGRESLCLCAFRSPPPLLVRRCCTRIVVSCRASER